MTISTSQSEEVESLINTLSPPEFLNDEDARNFLQSLLSPDDSEGPFHQNDETSLAALIGQFFGDDHETEALHLAKSVAELSQRQNPPRRNDDVNLRLDEKLKLIDEVGPDATGTASDIPITRDETTTTTTTESPKRMTDEKRRKQRKTREERRAARKQRKNRETTPDTIQLRSATELEELDDGSSAWARCQATNQTWGGRGRGGRGINPHSTSTGNVHLHNVNLQFLDNELLQNATIQITQGKRYGLIGRNGVGKSTLLRRIANKSVPGFPLEMRVFLVSQEVEGGERTALQSVLDAYEDRTELLSERDRLEERLGEADTNPEELVLLAERLSDVVAELDAIGADEAEDDAKDILLGLQFTSDMLHTPTNQLSGGWRMRVALARGLFVPTDLLLLDEPTNHLDLHAVLWLENHLLQSDKTIIVVSHDQSFLDTCTDIIHFEHKRLRYHTGNFSSFEQQQSEKQARQAQILDASERQRTKAVAFVEKQYASANKKSQDPKKLKQAKMVKDKKLERIGNYREDGKRYKNFSLKKMSEEYLRTAEKVVIEAEEQPLLKFKFIDPSYTPGMMGGAVLAMFDDVDFGYVPNEPPLLHRLTLDIHSKSKVAVVGRNGSGKSTLLKLLTCQIDPSRDTCLCRGDIWRHASLRIGHITQHHVEALDEKHAGTTVLDYMGDRLRESSNCCSDIIIPSIEIRSHLGAFGLGGKHAKRLVGSLSGGEKMRLCFATVMAERPHLLVLDEPTNHLDMETLDALAIALNGFRGAIVIVSHNQGFLCGFCNELWIVENGAIRVEYSDSHSFEENFSAYRSEAIRDRSSTRRARTDLAKRATAQRVGAKQSGGFIG